MLDFIPLGRSRWKMGYMNFKPGFIGYILKVMLEKPDSGEVFYDDKRVDNLSKKDLILQRRRIGMIFQNFPKACSTRLSS